VAAVITRLNAPKLKPGLVFGSDQSGEPTAHAHNAPVVQGDVTVFDPRATVARHLPDADAVATSIGELLPEPGGAAALVTHNIEDDKKLLPVLLRSPLSCVGALGPRRRTDKLLAALAASGFTPTADELEKLHAPVGLDVGAETPAEIALAIIAEVRAAPVAAGGCSATAPAPSTTARPHCRPPPELRW
jgi:xanthine dehydrogenase accessory factor